MPLRTIEKILKQGMIVKNRTGNYQRKQNCFPKIDNFWKNLIRQRIYSFTKIKFRQRNVLLNKLKEISAGIDCKFTYGRNMLHAYLVKIGLQYQKADNQKVIIKSPRLSAWRYKYLIKVQKYREDGYLTVYLDETWFVLQDTVRMF